MCSLGLSIGSTHEVIVGGPLPIRFGGPASVLDRHLVLPGGRARLNRAGRNLSIQPDTLNRAGFLQPTSWASESGRPATLGLALGKAHGGIRSGTRNVNVWFVSTTFTPRNSRTLLSVPMIGTKSVGGWKFVEGPPGPRPPLAACAANRCTGGALIGPR